MRDTLFQSEEPVHETFDFTARVVDVFDDMVVRSVPHYDLIQQLLVQLALRCHGQRPIYDLGCSTGNTLLRLGQQSPSPLILVGIDKSQAMLDQCLVKLSQLPDQHCLHLVQADLDKLESLPHGAPGVIILCLVLQFLRPRARPAILRRLYGQLAPGGALLMVEKIVHEQPQVNSLLIQLHHEFKRSQGYSDLEIGKKREALENRLIPFQSQENLEILQDAGFEAPSIFFSWLNFQGYLALKA